MKTDVTIVNELLSRGVEEVVVREHLEKALREGKKLRVKFGIDPTAPDLHLGHTVPLRKLRAFQNAGHTVVIIIGDFTARIGDPSGRSETRKTLSEKEIKLNLKNYLAQAGKILNIKKAEVYFNSKWLEKNGLAAILQIAQAATIQQVLKRNDFEKRIKEDVDISLLETLYPLLQGYDSVAIKADLELGGTDQKFNLLMGRKVQRHFGMEEQDIMTLPILEGTDGVRKMSKSYGNYIGIAESPDAMFGKVMTIPDALIEKYFTLLTDSEVPRAASPYEAKLLLGETIVGSFHSPKAAKAAREEWIRVFSKRESPEDAPKLKLKNKKLPLLDLLLAAGIASKSEARRLIEQNAVKVNDAVKRDGTEVITLKHKDIVRIGKHRFFEIV